RSLQLLLGRPLKVTVEMGRDPLIPGYLGQQLSAVLLGLELRDLGVLLLKLLFEILSLLSLLIKLLLEIGHIRLAIAELLSVLARSEEHTSELQSRFDLVC